MNSLIKNSNNFDSNDDGRPISPKQEDCCGQGCNPCIFDIYQKLLQEWQDKKFNQKQIDLFSKNYLSPIKYNKFIVDSIENASEDSLFIEVKTIDDKIIFMSPTQHVVIRTEPVSNPYTPISWNLNSMKFLIKLYINGKSSNYFRKLNIGNEIFIRGPYGDFEYKQNSYENIVMFGIGSGIAALYPLAQSIVNNPNEETKISMCLGFRSYYHVPLIPELRLLTDFWNLECTLCLSQKSDHQITGIDVRHDRIDEDFISQKLHLLDSDKTLILICGTPNFNKFTEEILKKKLFLNYHIFQ